ncbi:xylulokinase [Marchantia polymorpha subsp. ruderalis]|uniref:Xylulose kinase n=2 Tax=Marchantia polymorpha TaxID=3197 RepID=A0A176VX18_MARPO|nr:hypothetical protein AXG93_3545s1070 [Marchantia polymorpha subsp. ruderalis]PTQ28896.1 hypothetical protein MARPO_0152s0012 [Marchantia polymorpha]BBN14168.1 hypothetical protein Mp_6g09440 [Marchantia polymorpha subsp. ruderalis]|eukprot:PTQ28896.1 hypothetical protein MARPO_0152s0012 [Marchantia polymorpha]
MGTEDDVIYLGFDSSTQSLKVTALDAKLKIVAFENVHFDSELPHYETKDGVHRNRGGIGRITGPVLMWVEALQTGLDKLKKNGFPFHKVVAVSGSGQQHGSVYWKIGSSEVLRRLDASQTLVSQLKDVFSTNDSPVWMDSSSSKQCEEIEEALGGPQALCDLTGSRAHERFTGPQIRKLYQTQEDVYNTTERISLVSSFMASLLVGNYASIDHADGAGMNLMDLKERTWSDAALEATAPNLKEKLGNLAPSHGLAGKIHSYFVNRYGFSPECVGINWSGDNPCSLAGLAIEKPGDLGISLGTSDTVFGVSTDPKPGVDGHIFPNPVDPNSYMCMLCYKNGSLTRQEVRDKCAGKSWDTFNRLLDETSPLNGGKIGFYYSEPEILPPLPAGRHRFDLKENSGSAVVHVDSFDDPTEVRAIVEGQFMAMRSHAKNFGMPDPERVIATGGASANHHLLRVCADVFGCNVYIASRPDSASLGAALRAAHGHRLRTDKTFTFASLLKEASEDSATQLSLATTAGASELHGSYDSLAEKKLMCEKLLLQLSLAQSIPID